MSAWERFYPLFGGLVGGLVGLLVGLVTRRLLPGLSLPPHARAVEEKLVCVHVLEISIPGMPSVVFRAVTSTAAEQEVVDLRIGHLRERCRVIEPKSPESPLLAKDGGVP